MSGDDLSYSDIVDRLNMMADRVAETCIPNGRRDGIYWRGDLHGKVSVHVRGGRAGTVGYWQGQHVANEKGGGNLVTLIELAFDCQSHGEAVRIAKERFLGIGRREFTPEEKRRWAQQQEASKQEAEKRKAADDRERERKAETAQLIWHEAKPIGGTLAEQYLGTRLIELSDFPAGATWMPSLRFHPALAFDGGRHPGLVGGVQAKDRKLVAVWRILLRPDGKALMRPDAKGVLKKVKLGLGPAAGGAVRLAPAGRVLRLTEGLETGLGVMLLTGCRVPVWATLSTSGMVGFQIPDGVKRIEIYADADRHREDPRKEGQVVNPPGLHAAKLLQERALREGVEAAIFPSPEPDDWLDVFQAVKRDRTKQRAVMYQD